MTTRHRRRPHGRALTINLTPEEELRVRLDREPADVAEALDELDAETNEVSKLHRLFISQAIHFGQFARTAQGDDNRRYHLARALNAIEGAQHRRR